jgi:hypothetical protein
MVINQCFIKKIAKSQQQFYMVLFRKIELEEFYMREEEFRRFLINNADIESR